MDIAAFTAYSFVGYTERSHMQLHIALPQTSRHYAVSTTKQIFSLETIRIAIWRISIVSRYYSRGVLRNKSVAATQKNL